jgi:hypothetical protein
MTDAGLDWIMDYFNQQLRREGKTLLPRRFSAGYADFNLENQKAIYDTLQMEKIGVTITRQLYPPSGKISYRYQRHLRITLT